MGEGAGVAPGVQMRHVDLGVADNSVERHHLVVSALRSAFCTGAVIAADVDEQRVVHYTHLLQGIHQTSYLLIRVLGEYGKGLHLPGLQFLLFWSLGIPGWDLLGSLGQLRILRDDPHLFLSCKRLLALHVPSLIELAFIAVDVRLGYVMRSVQRTRGEVNKKWIVGCKGVLRLHPCQGLVRHVYREVIVGIRRVLHSDRSIEDGGRPLVGLTADETVELVKTGMCEPAVKRSGNRDLPRGGLVVLAEGGGAVSVQTQHLG